MIAVYWRREDVKQVAEDMGILLSDEDISAILKNVLDKYHRRFSAWVVVQSAPCPVKPLSGNLRKAFFLKTALFQQKKYKSKTHGKPGLFLTI